MKTTTVTTDARTQRGNENMTETEREFCDRVERIEARYKGTALDKYVEFTQMPRELLVRLRDELERPGLFATTTATDASGNVSETT